jgi:gamma-glutamylcyclotransferase
MYYFAYGSNLNKKQMRERCPDSKPVFRATLPNYKLIFTGWSRQWHGGVASIKAFRGERVIGAIYEISDADLRKLDKLEGYPTEYNRLPVRVFNEDGDAVEAMTYIRAKPAEETRPSPEYLAILQQGYRDWGVL